MKDFLDNNNEGYLLVLTMITIVVLLSFGAALLNISLSEFKQAEKNKNEIKAYYLARAGAELMADSIINGDINAETNKYTVSEDNKMVIKEIEVSEDDDDYSIQTTAEVNGEEESIKLTLKAEEIVSKFDKTIFTNGNINLSHNNAHVSGEIESKNKIIDPDNKVQEENKIENSTRPMPPIPDFPELISPGGKIKNETTIDEDSYYEIIKITGSGGKGKGKKENLIIDTTNGTDFTEDDDIDIKLLVDNIDVHNELEILGAGRVFLFIKESGEFKTPNARSDQIFIILDEGASFTVQANCTFNGFIYGPDASVTINSKHTNFNGAIIADNLYKSKGQSQDAYQGNISYVQPPDSLGGAISTVYTRGEWSN